MSRQAEWEELSEDLNSVGDKKGHGTRAYNASNHGQRMLKSQQEGEGDGKVLIRREEGDLGVPLKRVDQSCIVLPVNDPTSE